MKLSFALIISAFLAANAARATQLTYHCTQNSEQLELNFTETTASENGQTLTFDSAQSTVLQEATYSDASGDQITLDQSLAQVQNSVPVFSGDPGQVVFAHGGQYSCQPQAILYMPDAVSINQFETANGYVTLTFNLPAQITSMVIAVAALNADGSMTAVYSPNTNSVVKPGDQRQVPVGTLKGNYRIDVTDQNDDTVATYYVTSDQDSVLPYLEPSAYAQSTDPEIIALSAQITANAKTPRDKVLMIHDWIANNIDYDFTADGAPNLQTDLLQSVRILRAKTAVCLGFSNLNAALLRAQGIPTQILTGSHHAWNQVQIDGVWYIDDTTWDTTLGKYQWINKLPTLKTAWTPTYSYLGFMPGARTDHFPGGIDDD